MSRKPTLSFLENAVDLLVDQFGIEKVRAALAKISNGAPQTAEPTALRQFNRQTRQTSLSVTAQIDQLKDIEAEKYCLLTDFYERLKKRVVLPESQDIRHFAQIVGLKRIAGKSRRDLVPKLMRFLMDRATDRLRVDIEKAANISEQQRQQGFSVLTDKLLGENHDLGHGESATLSSESIASPT